MERFIIEVGDITKYSADAVVNPVTADLGSSGSVSAAIFQAAGSQLMEELKSCGVCPPGGVVVTSGGALPAGKILHTVNPQWQGGDKGEAEQLASCYRNCLRLAAEQKCRTVIFPSISTGAYHFPVNIAAKIAVKTICDFLQTDSVLKQVTLVCLDQRTTLVYDMCLAQCR